jgi:predicted house-cleaning NTP pyrophosphatase (Maf/HAM1 superfamily)
MSILHARIYLASQNPRYRDSLKQIGVSFESPLLRHDPRRGPVVNEPQRVDDTTVTIANLDPERIAHYVRSNEGRDRAGSYAIDGFGAAYVTQVKGSHTALYGLPLFETADLLREAGLPIG